MPDGKKKTTQVATRPKSSSSVTTGGHPPLDRRPPLDEETLRRLRFAAIVYGAASVGIFFVSISFALGGAFFMAMLVLAPSIIMAGFSWQCFSRIK